MIAEGRVVRAGSTLRRYAIVFSLVGLVDALYLVFIKLYPTSPMCFGVGDCEAVNTSIYSSFHGIPIAVFGALAYAVILACLLLEPKMAFLNEWGPALEFGVALAGTLYSAYLTYIEIAVLRKICPYCVLSAVMITLVCVLSAARVQRFLSE